jgi:hypothetical protein
MTMKATSEVDMTLADEGQLTKIRRQRPCQPEDEEPVLDDTEKRSGSGGELIELETLEDIPGIFR